MKLPALALNEKSFQSLTVIWALVLAVSLGFYFAYSRTPQVKETVDSVIGNIVPSNQTPGSNPWIVVPTIGEISIRPPADTPVVTPTVIGTLTPSPTNSVNPTATVTVSASPTSTPTPTSATPTVRVQETYALNRKVFLLIFNPTYSNGQTLIQNRGWEDPDSLTSQAIAWWKTTSRGRVNYSVAQRLVVNDFTYLEDGRKYTEATFEACLANDANCYKDQYSNWMMMDYEKMLVDYGICGKLNSGEIDELWMYGGPYFGFYESRMAGPGAFFYNSSPITSSNCGKRIAIMGYSYERALAEIIEDFGHRFEFTLYHVFRNSGSTIPMWRYFMARPGSSVAGTNYGIGNTHSPANTSKDYEWDNPTVVNSFATDFFENYPNFSTSRTTQVSCATWGCTQLGYFRWMFQHMPTYPGTAQNGTKLDWWGYLFDPNTVQ